MPPSTTPAPAPTPTPAAPTPAPAVPPEQPPAAETPPPAPSSSSSKKIWIIAVVVVALIAVMAAVVIALYLMLFSPAAVTKRVSNEFMKAAAAGDTQKLYEITNSTTDDEKAFLDAAAAATKGDYTLKEGTVQNDIGYYLYDLSNEQGKMSRTTIEKKDGEYVVTGYVFGSDNLALVPSGPDPLPESQPNTDPAPSTGGACLVAADFDAFYKEKFGPSDTTAETVDNSKTGVSGNVHFKSGSLEYADANGDEYMIPFAHFVRDNPDKDYIVEMYGSVGNQNSKDLDLADQRAAKLKAVYLKNGGTEAKLKVIPASTAFQDMDESYNTVDEGRDRVVVFKIVPSQTCSGGVNNSLVQ